MFKLHVVAITASMACVPMGPAPQGQPAPYASSPSQPPPPQSSSYASGGTCDGMQIGGSFTEGCKQCLRTSCCTELQGCTGDCPQGSESYNAMSSCMGGACFDACFGGQGTGNKCFDTACRTASDCEAVGCGAGCMDTGRCAAF